MEWGGGGEELGGLNFYSVVKKGRLNKENNVVLLALCMGASRPGFEEITMGGECGHYL